jgi:predicted Zn-ribbon and HTH transcriptional regulator
MNIEKARAKLEALEFEVLKAKILLDRWDRLNRKYIDGLFGEEEFLALKELEKDEEKVFYKPVRCTRCGIRIASDEPGLCPACAGEQRKKEEV